MNEHGLLPRVTFSTWFSGTDKLGETTLILVNNVDHIEYSAYFHTKYIGDNIARAHYQPTHNVEHRRSML